MNTLNEVYSSLSSRRRYEVWFLRLGLADGSGAWWFRYLLTNPGKGGCPGGPRGLPAQIWATWFPRDGSPQSFIQGFPIGRLELSGRGRNPFHFKIGENEIEENSCWGDLEVDGHRISWDLEYRSAFRVTLSNKGWIGFSRTPHSDACFSGRITLDGQTFEANPLGFGVQGHNCGFRHRHFWTWAHAYFTRPDGSVSTLEALVYEMPFGLVFRKVVLWHRRQRHVFRTLRGEKRDDERFAWTFRCERSGTEIEVEFDGCGSSIHRLPYVKTDCSGTFEVKNNSLSCARMRLKQGQTIEDFETAAGAVLEMVGEAS